MASGCLDAVYTGTTGQGRPVRVVINTKAPFASEPLRCTQDLAECGDERTDLKMRWQTWSGPACISYQRLLSLALRFPDSNCHNRIVSSVLYYGKSYRVVNTHSLADYYCRVSIAPLLK